MNYKKNISGLEFTRFRLNKGLSQSQIAAILGVSTVTVKAWEHERRNVPLPINNFIRLSIQHVEGEQLARIARNINSVARNNHKDNS